jgi:Ca2+-binding EF-hand superfamily protein
MPDKKIIDMKEFLDEESDYYKVKADTPELEKLLSIFDADSVISKGEYTSDAVAEHNYLGKLEEKQTKENLEEYLQSCLMILDKLYHMIRSG